MPIVSPSLFRWIFEFQFGTAVNYVSITGLNAKRIYEGTSTKKIETGPKFSARRLGAYSWKGGWQLSTRRLVAWLAWMARGVRSRLVDREFSIPEAAGAEYSRPKVEAGKHNVFTHFPKDRNCEVCKRTKVKRAPCRVRASNHIPRAENFGDLITADQRVLNDECESRHSHRYAVIVQNVSTQWLQAYPCKTKTSQETEKSSRKFLIKTGNWQSLRRLIMNHCTSTPHRSETNGTAERSVRRVKEGTSAILLQSGLDEKWWANSMECYCYLRNVQDILSDGKTPYERRFGEPSNRPIIPPGSMNRISSDSCEIPVKTPPVS